MFGWSESFHARHEYQPTRQSSQPHLQVPPHQLQQVQWFSALSAIDVDTGALHCRLQGSGAEAISKDVGRQLDQHLDFLGTPLTLIPTRART